MALLEFNGRSERNLKHQNFIMVVLSMASFEFSYLKEMEYWTYKEMFAKIKQIYTTDES